MHDLEKQKLKVKGQEFVLDAQLKILRDQTQSLKDQEEVFLEEVKEKSSSLSRESRENTRQQISTEEGLRQLNNEADGQERTHFEHKMHIDKEKASDEEALKRHESQIALEGALKERKETELEGLKQGLE